MVDITQYYDLRLHVDWGSLTEEQIDDVIAHRLDAYFRLGKYPKREGYVIERIASIENLRAADFLAQDGKKPNRFIREHNRHAERDLRGLQRMILTLDFPRCNYRVEPTKSDAGKVRDIAKQDYFPWHILNQAIMIVVAPRIYRSLIYDTCASIKGRGTSYAVKRTKMMLRRYKPTYYWQADCRKFYQSIPHDVVLKIFARMYKDEHFLRLIEKAICTYESDVEQLLIDEQQKRFCNRGVGVADDWQHCA
jgi:hypothetical protein